MHNDLAQMAKAKGIYRTLALCAILSPKPVKNEINKCPLQKDIHKPGEQAGAGNGEVKDKCMASPG
jgi:hypothetical protein